MDPHLLKTFVCVTEHGSFSAAALQLGYTQSAVSQHIAALEAQLGTALLHRRPVGPTDAGLRLLEHAGPILLRLEAARADVVKTVTRSAPLHLGATSLALLPVLAASLPGGVSLTGGTLTEVALGVASGQFDAGFVAGMAAPSDPLRLPDTGPLHRSPLSKAEFPLGVVLPSTHPLAGRSSLRLSDLNTAVWLDAPDAAIALSDIRSAMGAAHPLRTSIRYTGLDVRTVLSLASAGHGLAVLPLALATGVAVPLTMPRLVHRVELLSRNPDSRVLQALVGFVSGT